MLNKRVKTSGNEAVIFEIMACVLVGAFHPNRSCVCYSVEGRGMALKKERQEVKRSRI